MKKMRNEYQADYSNMIDLLGSSDEDVDIKAELALQLERERKSASDYSEFYGLADMMETREGAAYRSGEAQGVHYMTNEDYNRIILERTRIPSYVMGSAAPSKIISRPATVYNVMGCGKSMVGTGFTASVCENVINGTGYELERVERSRTNFIGNLIFWIDQWFPKHTPKKQDRSSRRRLVSSAAGMAWVLIFAVVLALPITLGVLKSEAIFELNEKRDALYALEETEAELKAEFESSLDLRQIERIATEEIGMIKLNESTIRVLRLNDIDSIESFTNRKSNSVVPALLSALGIRVGDE